MGFMAAWFLAASPIRRSSAVKETKEGVVKEPCSLATVGHASQNCALNACESCRNSSRVKKHTDLDIVTVVVGNARVGGA